MKNGVRLAPLDDLMTERAARGIYALKRRSTRWEDLTPTAREGYRKTVRALHAAFNPPALSS